MLKRKVSCTFKRKNALDNQERIYLLSEMATRYGPPGSPYP